MVLLVQSFLRKKWWKFIFKDVERWVLHKVLPSLKCTRSFLWAGYITPSLAKERQIMAKWKFWVDELDAADMTTLTSPGLLAHLTWPQPAFYCRVLSTGLSTNRTMKIWINSKSPLSQSSNMFPKTCYLRRSNSL